MRLIAIVFIVSIGAGLSSAQTTNDQNVAAKKTSAAKKSTAPAAKFLTIPSDAVSNNDGTYTYTDKEGRKWSYWKSPFGVMRSEIKPAPMATYAPAAAPQQDLSYTTTTDKGEVVHFDRQTPFGPMSFDKKKSEMTDAERKLFESQHPESKQTKPE